MGRINLNQSGVVFNKEAHTYELNGKQLQGITGLIHKHLFENEFDNVPECALTQAAEYGTAVHAACEDFDLNWHHNGSQEILDYISICQENNLLHEASEYTVTDGQFFASNIDKVFRTGEKSFSLADIKTYGCMTPDKLEKARWQLSIYALFFELVNPQAKVDELLVLHLRNKKKSDGTYDHIKKVIKVNRIPKEIVIELLEAEKSGIKFLNPYDIPPEFEQEEGRIRELIGQQKAIDAELKQLKSCILSAMTSMDVKSWISGTYGTKFTRKLPTTRLTFSLEMLKADYPDIDYSKYMKESKVASSLLVTL